MKEALTQDQYLELRGIVDKWFTSLNQTLLEEQEKAGILYPTSKPNSSIVDEWSDLLDNKPISSLTDTQLENYLEKWSKLIGYSYWVENYYLDRVNTLTRCREFVRNKVYVYSKSLGGREIVDAYAESHQLVEEITEELNYWSRKLDLLRGSIRDWEKKEFSISRAISNRQSKPYRSGG
jgi:hypothetical protein